MDGREQRTYAARMPLPFSVREHWRDVSLAELEAFVREYPRPLQARPPVGRKTNYREWVDPTLGSWPGNAVAKAWSRGGCHGYQVRDLLDEPRS
jgi:hypothetical protein